MGHLAIVSICGQRGKYITVMSSISSSEFRIASMRIITSGPLISLQVRIKEKGGLCSWCLWIFTILAFQFLWAQMNMLQDTASWQRALYGFYPVIILELFLLGLGRSYSSKCLGVHICFKLVLLS